MNEFVEECRSEWKRLGVPDPVASEMAADLAADLEEAEAEGVSAEEVLGSGAFDPRSFATAWAAERGVIQQPRSATSLPRRPLTLAAFAALTVVTTIGAALVLFASPQASAPVAAVRVPPEFAAPGAPAPLSTRRVAPPPMFASPSAPVAVWITRDGRGVVLTQPTSSGVEISRAGSILLIVGIVASMLFLLWLGTGRGRAAVRTSTV